MITRNQFIEFIKEANMQKQALSPNKLLEALTAIARKGNLNRTLKMMGRVNGRTIYANPVLDAVLKKTDSYTSEANLHALENMKRQWGNLQSKIYRMEDALRGMGQEKWEELYVPIIGDGRRAARNVGPAYENSVLSQALGLIGS